MTDNAGKTCFLFNFLFIIVVVVVVVVVVVDKIHRHVNHRIANVKIKIS